MNGKSRYKAATIFVAFVLLLGGIGLLVANPAAAQPKKIQGVVTEEGEPTTLLNGATVTLFDAHGQKDPLVALTGSDGKYTFTPSPGFYYITVSTGGYFDERTTVFRFDGTANLLKDIQMEAMPAGVHSLTVHVQDNTGASLDDVLVEVYNVTPERTQRVVAGTTDGAFARPDSDISDDTDGDTNRWTPSTGAFLYAVMDETTADDTDYAVSPTANGDQGFEVGLSNVADPQASDNHLVRYRYRRTTGQFETVDLDVELRQGGVVIASWSHINIDTAWVTAERTLTQAQADSITNYTNLRLRFMSSRDVVFGGTARISWAELEVPLAIGNVTFPTSLWTGDFEIRASKQGYAVEVTPVTISGDTVVNVTLVPGIKLVGFAQEPDGSFVEEGLVAHLYNIDVGTADSKRLIAANVSGSSYTFYAYTGNFTLIVDADGKAANVTDLLYVHPGMTPAERRIDRVLGLSPEERVDLRIEYVQDNWNDLSLRRTLNLNNDSGIPGLPLSNLRHLRLQIDANFGNKNGVLEASEIDLFRQWLMEIGPKFVDTQNLFHTDTQSYRSLVGGPPSFNVTVDIPGSGSATIVEFANYTVVGTAIAAGNPQYTVDLRGSHDTNDTVYINRSFTVAVVTGYERTFADTTGTVEVKGYTTVAVDPSLAVGDFQVEMTLKTSLSGTAIVQVVGPPGRFTELNVSTENYTVVIPTDQNITFSAEESTDPNSPDGRVSPDSNFTWVFTNVSKVENAYGIRPTVSFAQMGDYTGNLTIVETGGNQTFSDFMVLVDGVRPVALIENNVTGFGVNANNTQISIKEGDPVSFFGGNSTDDIHAELVGEIVNWRWDLDGDGETDTTGENIEWTFSEPGSFTVNLTVVDLAGHESENATMSVQVADTTPPQVSFVIRDKDGSEVTSLTEGRVYTFNASATTDNLDTLEDLAFLWSFGDGTEASGVSVTHTYDEYGDYDLLLNVTDQAGNVGNSTRELVVEVDPPTRPDLEIEVGSLVVDPRSPEESSIFGSVAVTIRLNVTNKEDRARAGNITVEFWAFRFGEQAASPMFPTFRLLDENGNEVLPKVIEPGQTRTVEFTWVTGSQGNYTLRVNVTDVREPPIFRGPRNSVETQIDVRQAFWVTPAIIAAAVGVIGGIPTALYLRRRFRAKGRERITKK